MNAQLRHLSTIWTKDLDQTISFYETILGFRMQSRFPDFASMMRHKVEIMFVLPTEGPEDYKDTGKKEEFFP